MANLKVTTGAADTVPVTQASFLAVAEEAIENARDAMDSLARSNYIRSYGAAVGDKPSYNVDYTPPPGKPEWSFSPNIPSWSNMQLSLSPIEKIAVSDFTGDPPGTVTPSIPSLPAINYPGDLGLAPVVKEVIIPEAPILDTIADPKEWAIHLPSVPVISIPSFTAKPPSAEGINAPKDDFSWSEIEYDSEVLSNTIALVNKFNQGGVVIPPVIWEALWARDNDRENRAGEKLINEINSDWSSRGFQLPQGVQNAQIAEVHQNIQSVSSERSRDIAIKEADMNIENLKFAVNQGIALENMRGGWYQQALNRNLDAAKFTYSLSVNIFNAKLSFYNAQLTSYQAEAMVYKTQIEAELVKLEIYKSELEGQKIIGDLNMQQVQIYKIRVDALNTTIELYNAELKGIQLGVEIDATRIDAYSKEVQAYGEKIKAESLKLEAFKTTMQGAKIEADIYAVNVSAYASKVQAYSTKVDASAKSSNIDIEINKTLIQEYTAKLQAFTVETENAIAVLKSEVAAFDSSAKSYDLDVTNERSRTLVILDALRVEISAMIQGTQVNITSARLDLEAAKAEAALGTAAIREVSSTEGALAGSAMSAVNVSSGMTDYASNQANIT